jgi:hypothetical protein
VALYELYRQRTLSHTTAANDDYLVLSRGKHSCC